MKKTILLILCMLTFLQVDAQKNKAIPDTAIAWSVYKTAISYSDLDVAKSALFEIIAIQPQYKPVYDTLANVYFRLGAYAQAIKASDAAEQNSNLKEIKAYSLRNLGDVKSALPIFEELFASNSSPENGYQVASIQFTLKRYGECLETTGKILSHPDVKTKKVIISAGDGKNMNVSYLAATENLRGVLYLEMGKKDLAKLAFERALAEAPDFILAKENLSGIANAPVTK